MGIYGRRGFAMLLLLCVLLIWGCGGRDDDLSLVSVELKNLSPLEGPFTYAAWVESGGRVSRLDVFNTGPDGTIAFSRFALLELLTSGDRVFVTIQPVPDPEPFVPSETLVLDGTIVGNTAVLTFPRLQDFGNATGFATISEDRRQLLTEFSNLPDVSDRNFIYQGFLRVGAAFFPLQRFRFDQVPVSDTVGFDLTTAEYILAVEPVQGSDPFRPYSIQPFFTMGTLQPGIRQQLVRSSLTPDDPNFRFPSGIAVIR